MGGKDKVVMLLHSMLERLSCNLGLPTKVDWKKFLGKAVSHWGFTIPLNVAT